MKNNIFLICALAMFLATGARADDVSADLACKFHHAVSDVGSTFTKLPAPIVNFVLAKTGEMAERDQYFNATDVMLKNAPMHRFIRAGREDDRWFVWFERGGIAYNRNIVVLAWKPGEASPRLIAHTLYFGENPCRLTDGILDGHLPAQSSGRW